MTKYRFLYCLIVVIVISFSCTNNKKKEEIVFNQKNDFSSLPFDQRIKREVESKLSIPGNEKYDLEIIKSYLNADNKEDAVITVNRYQFALDEASKAPNTAQIAEMGYTGNYNFFFYFDGKSNLISNPIAVPSSPKAPLEVLLENNQSEAYKDITIVYRIRNSAFKNYYLIENGIIQIIFQWKLFDFIGTNIPEANFINYENGSYSLFKDILIYKGKIKDYSPIVKDVYTYNPIIENEGTLLYRFFYDPKTMKYMTKKK